MEPAGGSLSIGFANIIVYSVIAGLCVIAGNISPIDVITHVPILCEESDIPYVYVHSKESALSGGSMNS
ncbi:hypothetical protein TanjilG_09922 [Lupinus angustifolius]|uniref:Ribosomal protein eL8/eL30/eS12/Gadd45 domain-containing protein n=1 Tax=Lupinus angustifolius TaxID=3871 RepID=A0A1J7HQV0_LUPAN|nr:hypothetical protein TanjilG_09922 [Lupinus angustifolius]